MKKLTLLAGAIALALAGCAYQTMDACEDATGTVCHMSLDGRFHQGPGIPIDSPAGQAILGGVIAGSLNPPVIEQPHPYVLPMPQVPNSHSFTCTSVNPGTVTCN